MATDCAGREIAVPSDYDEPARRVLRAAIMLRRAFPQNVARCDTELRAAVDAMPGAWSDSWVCCPNCGYELPK